MSLAIVRSRANIGIEAPLVTVEAHLSGGLPAFTLVGLPETVVRESRERVRSAILQSGFDFPQRRITVNLAPADLPKTGGRFDLAIAIGILAASRQLGDIDLTRHEFFGELSLTGELRRVEGILPGLVAADRGGRDCIVPRANAPEAGLLASPRMQLGGHLVEVLGALQGRQALPRAEPGIEADSGPAGAAPGGDFADVVGQAAARRALLLAAAGGHNLLMRGPPGTGKTMLASRLAGILPALDKTQALELASIRSIAGQRQAPAQFRQPPFRAPHHSSSAVALTGGGSTLHTGEISLAHHGVLFLDELPEFPPRVLEGLREPLEAGEIRIARARYQVTLPARFQLLAAMNPCPCGYAGDPDHGCRCTPDRIRQYRQRISGPLLDRIDLILEVPRLAPEERQALLGSRCDVQSSADMRQQVEACRQLQLQRSGCINARLDQDGMRTVCALSDSDHAMFDAAVSRLKLSTRACFRLLRIARTIADLDGVARIGRAHLLEALNYRRWDRGGET